MCENTITTTGFVRLALIDDLVSCESKRGGGGERFYTSTYDIYNSQIYSHFIQL